MLRVVMWGFSVMGMMSKEELVQVTMSRVLLHRQPGGQYPFAKLHN
jgi:hypothetical protein